MLIMILGNFLEQVKIKTLYFFNASLKKAMLHLFILICIK